MSLDDFIRKLAELQESGYGDLPVYINGTEWDWEASDAIMATKGDLLPDTGWGLSGEKAKLSHYSSVILESDPERWIFIG